MSTPKAPSKKKQPVKPVEQKARFVIGQKVFIIDEQRSKSGEVLQAEILSVQSIRMAARSDTGKIDGAYMDFEYEIRTAYGEYSDVHETRLYPTLVAVSVAFTQNFINLLK